MCSCRFGAKSGERWRKLGVHQETHRSSRGQHGVIQISRGAGDAGANVFSFQIGEVCEDFLGRGSIRQHVQDILHADTHSANAGSPAALIGIGGDAIHTSLRLGHKKTAGEWDFFSEIPPASGRMVSSRSAEARNGTPEPDGVKEKTPQASGGRGPRDLLRIPNGPLWRPRVVLLFLIQAVLTRVHGFRI